MRSERKVVFFRMPKEVYEVVKNGAKDRYMTINGYLLGLVIDALQKQEVKKFLEEKKEEK